MVCGTARDTPYVEGTLHGIARHFDRDGTVLSETHYEQGHVVSVIETE